MTDFVFDSKTAANYQKGMVAAAQVTISISDLADLVNQWCDERQITPANGQAGERITERNIRYYRSRGLLDAPGGDDIGRKRGFTEKHFLQLKVLRLLQARGLPLDQIQSRVHGRGVEELRAIERAELRMLADDGTTGAGSGELSGAELLPGEGERWGVSALGSEFFLVSRRGRTLTGAQRKMVAAVLSGALDDQATNEKSGDGMPS